MQFHLRRHARHEIHHFGIQKGHTNLDRSGRAELVTVGQVQLGQKGLHVYVEHPVKEVCVRHISKVRQVPVARQRAGQGLAQLGRIHRELLIVGVIRSVKDIAAFRVDIDSGQQFVPVAMDGENQAGPDSR